MPTAADTTLDPRPRTLNALGAQINISVTSQETAGSYAIIEFAIPPNFPGAPLHFHTHMPETFRILTGSIEIFTGDQWRTARPGDTVHVTPGTVHGYRNLSPEPASFLVVAPGHDAFFFELIEWMNVEPVWPPANRQALLDFGRRHDTTYV